MVHRIDAHDRLIGFDSAFRAFAAANGAPDLPEQWLGRSLWDVTSSSQINMVFRSLVERARRGVPVKVPGRCDSPSLLGFVEMALTGRPDGEVEISSMLIGARFANALKRTNRFNTVANPEDVLRVCAWCFRVDADGDGWRGIEEVVAERGLLLRDEAPDVTHGICPDCMRERMAEVTAAA
jgi:hypothetical protein